MSEETPPTEITPAAEVENFDGLDTILDSETVDLEPDAPETPTTEAAAPAAEPEKKPETTPAPVASEPPAPSKTASEIRLEELDAQIKADEFDAYTKDGRAALAEYARVAAKVEAEPLRRQLHDATIWSNLAEEHEIPVKTLRSTWADVTKALPGRSQDVLDYEFERRIGELKTTKKDPPAAAAEPAPSAPTPPSQRRIPIKPSNGNVAPPVGTPQGNRPPTPVRDAGEQFDRSVTASDLASLV